MSTRTTVCRDPKLLKGHRRRTAGADGWQPKSPRNSIWQGKPACWGLPESNHSCPGPNDIMREIAGTLKPALSISSRAKVQSQPRSRPRWGNGRSRAQWNFQTMSVIFAIYSPLKSESCQATTATTGRACRTHYHRKSCLLTERDKLRKTVRQSSNCTTVVQIHSFRKVTNESESATTNTSLRGKAHE